MDSNHLKKIQNLLCFRYTKGPKVGLEFIKRGSQRAVEHT